MCIAAIQKNTESRYKINPEIKIDLAHVSIMRTSVSTIIFHKDEKY